MTIDMRRLGKAIKNVRLAKGLSQAKLASLAGLSNDRKAMALIESGQAPLSKEKVNAISKALGLPPECLTILGAEQSGNKASKELVGSLQQTISALVVAKMGFELNEMEKKSTAHATSSKRKLLRVADLFGLELQKKKRAKKARKKIGSH